MPAHFCTQGEALHELSDSDFLKALNHQIKIMRLDPKEKIRARRNSVDLQAYAYFLSVSFYGIFFVLTMVWMFLCGDSRLLSTLNGRELLSGQNKVLTFTLIQGFSVLLFPICNLSLKKIFKIFYFLLSFLLVPILLCSAFPFRKVIFDIFLNFEAWSWCQAWLLFVIFLLITIQFFYGTKKIIFQIPKMAEFFGRRFISLVRCHAAYGVWIYIISLLNAIIGFMRPDFAGEIDNFKGFLVVYSLCLNLTALIVVEMALFSLTKSPEFLWYFMEFRRSRKMTSFHQNPSSNDMFFQ